MQIWHLLEAGLHRRAPGCPAVVRPQPGAAGGKGRLRDRRQLLEGQLLQQRRLYYYTGFESDDSPSPVSRFHMCVCVLVRVVASRRWKCCSTALARLSSC